MPRIAYLKRLYLLASVSFFVFWTFKLLSVPSAERNPNPMGLVFCLLLFAGLPTVGYILLFKILPWAGRRLRPS